MTDPNFPLIIECDELASRLDEAGLVIIDLCKKETWAQAHIPGTVHLDYPQVIRMAKPVMGLLPDAGELAATLASAGVNNDSHIVAYDDEGGGKAARLLWSLEAYGFSNYSLLNGGLVAWANEGWPLTKEIEQPVPGNFMLDGTLTGAVASREEILAGLAAGDQQLLDARSNAEYTGMKKFAARGGHIPGAIHYDWMDIMDPTRNGRLREPELLARSLQQRGFDSDKRITCYCQTHHRSALSFIMLKSLGYTNIAGYPGSWSDWGNATDTPIEA